MRDLAFEIVVQVGNARHYRVGGAPRKSGRSGNATRRSNSLCDALTKAARQMKPNVVFWYEFASTYSYLAAMRIDAEAAACRRRDRMAAVPARADFQVARAGRLRRSTSIQPKAATWCATSAASRASRGLSFRMPATFPANGLKAARLAIAAAEVRGDAGFHARGVRCRNSLWAWTSPSDDVLADCLTAAGLDPAEMWALKHGRGREVGA